MRLQDFHFEVFERPGASQEASLRELWQDAGATTATASAAGSPDIAEIPVWHVLARDAADHALGCGSLFAGGRIDCLVVRGAWRRRGIGTAILAELAARARALGMQDVTLDAPDGMQAFCRHAGFIPDAGEMGDAGTMRRPWRLAIPRPSVETPPLRDTEPLPAGSRGEVAAARLQLLADARHQLLIYLPTLAGDAFGTAAELEQLRRIACSGRAAGIRIVLHDPGAAVAGDHPLLPLAQRLATAFQIRTPTEPVDLAYGAAYLLNDAEGYLFLPDASRPAGRAARRHRAAQAPLRRHFDEAWERAERASILNHLDL